MLAAGVGRAARLGRAHATATWRDTRQRPRHASRSTILLSPESRRGARGLWWRRRRSRIRCGWRFLPAQVLADAELGFLLARVRIFFAGRLRLARLLRRRCVEDFRKRRSGVVEP